MNEDKNEDLISIDTKLEIIYYAEKILESVFPQSYQEDSEIKIFIDSTSDPIKILVTGNENRITESQIGKIELIVKATEEGKYSIVPIMTIWTQPLEKSVDIIF